jgi:hypothetical protein
MRNQPSKINPTNKENDMSNINNINNNDPENQDNLYDPYDIYDPYQDNDEARWMKEVNQEEWEREMLKIEKMLEEVWG